MTAMPPTKGHRSLIEFAQLLTHNVTVIVATQPGEPYVEARVNALRAAFPTREVTIQHLHRELPQEPEQAEGFWELWVGFLTDAGLQPGDYIVASELYGKVLAEKAGAIFMPYDIERELLPGRATMVRKDPMTNFGMILPEFQPTLRRTITIFGAESTGKTTLSKELAECGDGHWLYEYARPYLMNTSPELTIEAMTSIWQGQFAIQRQGRLLRDKPFVIQDTDLYSTLGYWENWSPETVPEGLEADARWHKSDLYIITPSDIPFEPDPLRYGGDKRELDDQYWIDLAIKHKLPYVVLKAKGKVQRVGEALGLIENDFDAHAQLHYLRS